ncbi:N-acetylglucosamine-specific PTS transporter subunit IIBC [Faecalicatena sp. AGMB00832]|uniref:N-acetylglucosamine-specific PTS transporter subunit IIBC n=1 Tax=Faecalicatena faecalis TaxID=2726362 RepID=A0ABS6D6D1_9FIRM|nr:MULTISPECIES: N-acetylglucosamine-specific PTS transporter subunit IIBC [Faecalicatena]MBU3877153.1 N-acetylglucosamine-specific PTS transporter subunit IIBC [Faecalicatena faecalis]MCI6467158.1 N-acetylglucosamine-specific PTS transporter subunit IIBC [Faecalicatena sp.]MDY5618942.1 N-acetylglucosamine-specific PTS transporter subunit IIBC [Lachnospiraceae bacterium]
MKYLQRLGKSLMLPVACLPVAAILQGIGYWLDPSGWGANSVVAAFLLKAGGVLIDQMAILFAIGVAVGMSDDNDGTAGLAGLVSWLMTTTILSPPVVAMLLKIEEDAVNPAFGKIQTQFIGILCGLIAAGCYNKFKSTKLPDAFSFFSGKRCVAIVTAGASIVSSLILFFAWPVIYGALMRFGEFIMNLGAFGAGLYGFFNRLLIPFGLHHALNSVFWFDVAGINDIGKFWGTMEGGILGQTGMYMSGFFPVMMFGLPAAALAMYHTAKDNKKKIAAGLLFSAAIASFFNGVTEPLEFSFMFLAPALYGIHAVLTGISMAVVALLPVRAGFNFSAGLVDWVLSFKAPFAENSIMLIPIGIVVGIIYYIVFRIVIVKFNLKTPGREDDDMDETKVQLANDDFTAIAQIVLEGVGGKENVTSIDNCITRLRLEIKDYTAVDEKKIKSAGVAGVIRPSKTAVQVIIGTKVQFVADEFKKLCK